MIELLKRISNDGITIDVVDGELQLLSSEEIKKDLLLEIKAKKKDIISYLLMSKESVLKKVSYKKIPKTNLSDNYPLSHAQKRLWIESQIEENSVAFNMPTKMVLEGDYNLSYFKKAIQEVIIRHEILRTVFRINDEGTVNQIVLNPEEFKFTIDVIDLRNSENPEEESTIYIQKDSYNLFDFEKGPLLRAAILQLSDNKSVFYYNMHHIISDGDSMEILSRDVVKYYEAFLKGVDVNLPDLAIQYKDYTIWQSNELKKHENHRAYWKDRLKGEITKIDLPTTRVRPSTKTYNGINLETHLSTSLSNQVKLFIRTSEGSLFTFLSSVVNVLLYKYTNQKEIILGSPMTERIHPDLENQIGFYVNTLAIKSTVDPNDSFNDFYRKTKEEIFQDYNHKEYPFDKLIEDLSLQYDKSRSPLFDISITIHNEKAATVGALVEETRKKGVVRSKNDIEFHFTSFEDTIVFQIIYNNDVYDEETISKMMIHFKSLLRNVITTPEQKIFELEYLLEEEKKELLIAFNESTVDFEKFNNKTIIDFISKQALEKPDVKAIVFENKSLTYKELNERSTQFSNCLIKDFSISKGNVIGIHLDRSEHYIICLLGILKAGGVYLPIDTNYPKERKEFILKDAAVELLISDTSYVFDLEYYDGSILAVDVEFEPQNYDVNYNNLVSPEDTAYIIYTSGSTGKPKGVIIPHKSILNTIHAQLHTFKIKEEDNILQFASFSFDASIFEIFLALSSGACSYIINENLRNDIGLLEEYIIEKNINIATLSPSIFHIMSDEALKNIKTLITAGEVPNYEKVMTYLSSGGTYYNAYGPTETSIWASTYKMDSNTKLTSKNISIGYPVANMEIYILDEMNNLLPKGTVGELCVGGIGLAKGYLNRDILTNEKFIPHPFKENERIYKTGDLAKYLDDGRIEYVGRKDHQLKINGNRIELGELEVCLLENENIKQVVVIADEDGKQNKKLIAYLVSKSDIDAKEVEASLRQKLPDYMIPKSYVFLKEMPLTYNGKIDIKALPKHKGTIEKKHEFIIPKTAAEIALIKSCEAVLGIEKIGLKDNFYNLGGDSIKSIQIVSKLRQLGYVLKVGDILRQPIMEELVKILKKSTQSIDQSEVSGEVLLTPIQHFFFKEMNVKNVEHYNQSVLLKSSEKLNFEALKESISILVKHHDALRLNYHSQENEWIQNCSEFSEDKVWANSYHLIKEEDSLKKMGTICEELQSSFKLPNSPLFKLAHFKFSDCDRVALFAHHLVIDGVSWRIILEDISSIYVKLIMNEEVNLPQKTNSYQEWAKELTNYAKNNEIQKERNYWDNLTNTYIPNFKDIEENIEARKYKKAGFTLNKKLTSKLQSSIHEVYTTEINDVLLASFGMAFQKVYDVNKCVIEMEGHGREEIIDNIDISRTIGWFTSVYPHIIETTNESNLLSLVKVKDDLRKIPNKGIGFGILKYLTEEGFEEELEPRIQFNYLGDFGGKINTNDNKLIFNYDNEYIGKNKEAGRENPILLKVSGLQISGELTMSIAYMSDVYSDAEMTRLIDAFEGSLITLIDDLSQIKEPRITSSDLMFSDLTIEELEEINNDNLLENIYPLSPAQEGMYFHWLSSQNTYFEQVSYQLNWKELSKEAIQKAFDFIVDRHTILRTSFTENYGGQLLQIVKKKVPSNFNYYEVTENSDVNLWIEEKKANDKELGFNLHEPSQMRLTILDLKNENYEFIWSHHHILMDGWCASILINEFYVALGAIERNKEPALTPPKPYLNYIKWLSTVNEENSLTHWKNYLAGYHKNIRVPFAKSEGKNLVYKSKINKVSFFGELYNKINVLCENVGVTSNTFIEAVWGYLLSRYNDSNDVVFGSIVSGRPASLESIESMIGLFINTIPVRVQHTSKDSFVSLLTKTKERGIESLPHHYVSLAKVQSLSSLGMSLINHIMVFENFPVQDALEDQFDTVFEGQARTTLLAPVDVKEETNYDFNVKIKTNELGINVHFQYNENQYAEVDVIRLSKHFEILTNNLVNNPEKLLSKIDFISQNEKEILLETFNDSKKDFKKNKTLVHLFDNQVKETPNEAALFSDGLTLTYKELNEEVNKFANFLQQKETFQKGDLVGVHIDRSRFNIIALLGIMKIGGVYVPIDTAYPEKRKMHIINDANIKILVANEHHKLEIESYKKDFIFIDILSDELTDNSPVFLNIKAFDLAYVIYTSGSTGNPKGVMISHETIVNTILAQIDTFELEANDRSLQFASFSFDASISEIFITLLSGACLYVANSELRNDVEMLESYIENKSINVATLPPALFKTMNIACFKNFKTLITAGEAPDFDKAKEYLSLGKGNYYNAYGPTEVSICASIFKIRNIKEVNNRVIPIGKPLNNASIYILNDSNQLKPEGFVGEICVGGAGVAKGYLNLPELTEEKFIDNPFQKGEKLYKTGDLGYWLADGNLIFTGRKDDQVKINGYRVELGEIEATLNELDHIEQSIVLAKENENGAKQLIAYYTLLKEVSSIEIQEMLQNKLPKYMVPKLYMKLEAFPLNSNGKIDKKALPKPNEEAYLKKEYEAPSSDAEKLLVSLCEAVLGISKIGIGDNFLNLGGDSIKSILLVSRLRQHGYTLNVAKVLTTPVLKELAKLIKKSDKVIDQSEVVGEVELTPPQLYLFNDSGIKKNHHFNQSILLKSNESLDITTVKKSIVQLVCHHDALRMTFKENNGAWQQYNHKYNDLFGQVGYYDLSLENDGLKQMGEICENIQSTLNLSDGPLFIATHFKFKDTDYIALICHHLLIDGISWRIIKEDFTTLYEQNILGEIISLPKKTDSYQKWAIALNDYANSKILHKEIKYWKSLENDIPKLPIENNIDLGKRILKSQISFALNKEMTTSLQTKVHSVYNTGINDLLLTGLGLAIKKTFNIDKAIVNLEGHGREEIIKELDVSRTIGWFSAVHPVVLDMSKTLEIEESLIMTKDNLRKIPNNGVGYSILKYLNKDFSSKLTPEIMFNYLGDFGSGDNVNQNQKEIFEYASDYIGKGTGETTEGDLVFNLNGIIINGELRLSLSYNDKQFSKDIISNFFKNYKQNIIALIEILSSKTKTHITSADLTYSELNYKEVQKFNEDELLEDLYELSPTQEGMYYHWLTSKHDYFEQVCYKIKSDNLNIEDVKSAYEKLIKRYSILRTQFISTDSGKLLQLVKKDVSSRFVYNILPSSIEKGSVNDWIEERKLEDLNKGFDLQSPSQMRLTILDIGNSQYEFIWSIHHVLMDGWCAGILLNDFYTILQGIHNNITVELPVTRPYSEYIKWLRNVDKDESIAYWKKYLENYTSTIKVPFEYPNRIAQERIDTIETVKFSGECFDKIRKTCVNLGVTQNSFTELIWGILLSYYNNTNDVVFGSVVSGRPSELEGVEEMVGVFLNTVPVRISYSELDTFKSLLQKVQNNAINSLPHHYINLAEVQSQSEKGMSLIDHIMVFENFPIQEQIKDQFDSEESNEKPALSIASESVDIREHINYDFNLTVGLADSALKVHFQFDKNKYDEILIRKMGTHFYNIVQNVINNPTQQIKDITCLNKEEKNELLHVFNSEMEEEQVQENVLNLINKQVEKNPEKIALSFKEKEITYAELNQKTNQLANALIVKGVKKGSKVPIYIERSLETIISMLGILKAGATYVPLDDKMPMQRIFHILKDVKAKLIITKNKFAEKFDEEEILAELLFIENIKFEKGNINNSILDITISPEDLAYVMYTSGTTGTPKGVMISHYGLMDYVHTFSEYFSISDKDNVLQQSNITFDTSVEEIFPILTKGGELTISDNSHDFDEVLKTCTNEKITILSTHPYLIQYINEKEILDLPIRILISGGDVLRSEYISKIITSYNIYNTYGPTEGVVCASYAKVNKEEDITIGKPIRNKSIYILNENNNLLPVGITGELCIGGLGIAKGYLNDTKLTEEKFVTNPFSEIQKLYKTGDLARWLPNGNIEFIGRKDNQVNIRGIRIELGEIEEVLNARDDIEQSIVTVHKSSKENQFLVAYIVSSHDDYNNLCKELESYLPEYMIPRVYISIDKVPLTRNGKIDYKSLPIPNKEYDKEYIVPSSEIELILAEIWSETLDIKKVGINDNFFELGGNSLSAVKIMLKIRKKLNIDFDIKTLFMHNTIQDLALQLEFSLQQEELKSNTTNLIDIL